MRRQLQIDLMPRLMEAARSFHKKDTNFMIEERLALGCARLGSVLGTGAVDADELVAAAFRGGIRFFDTAGIYGQGESERILARAFHEVRDRVTIATKAGQYFPMWMRAAQPLKNILGPILNRSDAGRQLVSKARAGTLPQDFSYPFLRSSVEGSLRRLNIDCLDVLMLHSPPGDVIERGEAMGSLEHLSAEGKARLVGISCDDVESALLGLHDHRIKIIELPLWPWTKRSRQFLDAVAGREIKVLARGLTGAILSNSPRDGVDRAQAIREAVQSALALPGISRLIIGTTQISHLDEILQAAKAGETQ
jgi:aryl-alcohol dehydrogenase-like predicted oxidoreductase